MLFTSPLYTTIQFECGVACTFTIIAIRKKDEEKTTHHRDRSVTNFPNEYNSYNSDSASRIEKFIFTFS